MTAGANHLETKLDQPWKTILQSMFRQFTEFFFPSIHREIDWEVTPDHPDTELQPAPEDKVGRRYVDHLVRVTRICGEPLVILIHTEIQAQKDKTFPERLLVYTAKLILRYEQNPVTLVVLGDRDPKWRETTYEFNLWSYQHRIHCPSVKLTDYLGREEELKASNNPFALVTLAHLQALRTRSKRDLRVQAKLNLLVLLKEKGFSVEVMSKLLNFIDWSLSLPNIVNRRLWSDPRIAELKKMEYLCPIFLDKYEEGLEEGLEKGLKKGLKKGREEGEAKVVLRLLKMKFGALPAEVHARVGSASAAELEQWVDQILEMENLSDIFN